MTRRKNREAEEEIKEQGISFFFSNYFFFGRGIPLDLYTCNRREGCVAWWRFQSHPSRWIRTASGPPPRRAILAVRFGSDGVDGRGSWFGGGIFLSWVVSVLGTDGVTVWCGSPTALFKIYMVFFHKIY